MLAQVIAAALGLCRFRYANELELQASIEAVLGLSGVALDVEREVQLGQAGRIDFVVNGRIGIEVKIGGRPAPVRRQLQRYASSGKLEHLLLVTNRLAHTSIETVDCPTTVVLVMDPF